MQCLVDGVRLELGGTAMNTVLFVLLCVGFVIGVVCCCMGLYLVILRMRGVPKLGDVPGLGEIGTLQSGASLVLIGAYCFYYALSTYLRSSFAAEGGQASRRYEPRPAQGIQ